jgi:hypothetical protein
MSSVLSSVINTQVKQPRHPDSKLASSRVERNIRQHIHKPNETQEGRTRRTCMLFVRPESRKGKKKNSRLMCDSPLGRLAVIPFWRLAIEEALNNRPRLAATDQTNHPMFLTLACASKVPARSHGIRFWILRCPLCISKCL